MFGSSDTESKDCVTCAQIADPPEIEKQASGMRFFESSISIIFPDNKISHLPAESFAGPM
jgi:catabolite regulation protein CreA